MDFLYLFSIHTPRLRRTPLKRGLAVAVRLSLPKMTILDYMRRGGGIGATNKTKPGHEEGFMVRQKKVSIRKNITLP